MFQFPLASLVFLHFLDFCASGYSLAVVFSQFVNPLFFLLKISFDGLHYSHGSNCLCNDEPDSPTMPWCPVWAHTAQTHSPWKPPDSPQEPWTQGTRSWIRIILPHSTDFVSCDSLSFEWHHHPNCCLSQKAMNPSSQWCFTTNHSLTPILYPQMYLRFRHHLVQATKIYH